MLCSPPPATTLASSCAGSEGFCAPCCRRSSQRSRIHNRPKTGRTLLLHKRPLRRWCLFFQPVAQARIGSLVLIHDTDKREPELAHQEGLFLTLRSVDAAE